MWTRSPRSIRKLPSREQTKAVVSRNPSSQCVPDRNSAQCLNCGSRHQQLTTKSRTLAELQKCERKAKSPCFGRAGRWGQNQGSAKRAVLPMPEHNRIAMENTTNAKETKLLRCVVELLCLWKFGAKKNPRYCRIHWSVENIPRSHLCRTFKFGSWESNFIFLFVRLTNKPTRMTYCKIQYIHIQTI
jgi:hypothetical protein